MASLYRDDKTFFSVKDETWTILAVWAIMSYTGIVDCINKLINFWTGSTTSVDTLVVSAVFGIFVLIGTITALKKMQRKEFMLALIVCVAWLISFLLDENARNLLKTSYFKPVLIDGICGIICIARISDWEKFRKAGYFFVIPALILFALSAIFVINGDIETDYMSFSYNNLIFIIASYWIAIHKKNVLMWILAVVSTIFVIVTGCRGAIICIGVYIFCELLLNKRIHKALKAFIIIILVLAYFNLETIMVELDVMMDNFGYESRTVEMFLEGTLDSDSGRSKYTDAAIKVIEKNPVLGCGMAGSSYHLYEEVYGMKPVGVARNYSHNLFLDILMEYGILMGSVLIILLVYKIITALFRSRGKSSQSILFILLAAVMTKLMLSSTYLGEPLFFIMLGLLININDRENIMTDEVEA